MERSLGGYSTWGCRVGQTEWLTENAFCVLTSKLNTHYTGKWYLCQVTQLVKNLPAVHETLVGSLGWKDLLKKVMATHSTILAQRTPWTVRPGGLQSMGSQRVRHDWVAKTFTFILLHILFHCGISQAIEYSFLCYTVWPCCFIYSIIFGLPLWLSW